MDAFVAGEVLAFGDFRFDPRTARLYSRDAAGGWVPVPLGPRALDILLILLKSPGVVVSRDTIMDAVWPGVAVEPNNLTVHMAALRRVLDQGRDVESCIRTIPGRGYRLALEVRQVKDGEADPAPRPPADSVADHPVGAPPLRARSGRAIRRWRPAVAGAVSVTLLLLAAAWHAAGFPTPRRRPVCHSLCCPSTTWEPIPRTAASSTALPLT
jgi:DNA-binding winged helix-turn-helix (wHTH) protein